MASLTGTQRRVTLFVGFSCACYVLLVIGTLIALPRLPSAVDVVVAYFGGRYTGADPVVVMFDPVKLLLFEVVAAVASVGLPLLTMWVVPRRFDWVSIVLVIFGMLAASFWAVAIGLSLVRALGDRSLSFDAIGLVASTSIFVIFGLAAVAARLIRRAGRGR